MTCCNATQCQHKGSIICCLAASNSWCCGMSMMLLGGLPPSPWLCRHSWARHRQITRSQLHWACLHLSHCHNAWLLERYTSCCLYCLISLSLKTYRLQSYLPNFCVKVHVRLLVHKHNKQCSYIVRCAYTAACTPRFLFGC